MNVLSASSVSTDLLKKCFNLGPVRRDGLVLQIHHTINRCGISKQIRFLHSVYDITSLICACADFQGNVFIIDFSSNKYWCIPKVDSCCALAFSSLNADELIIGCNDGSIYIIDIHLGTLNGDLEGHTYPIKNISFANDQCLTASQHTAIIFNLRTGEKIHELSLTESTILKQVFFMPVTNFILACFSDDYIHIWKNKTFESYKKIMPTEWSKFVLKSIAVTRNGATMVLGGTAPKIIEFALDSWSLTRILTLPDEINIKSMQFISQNHDGGANKFLVILATNGTINFLDMEQTIVVGRIQPNSEIIAFSCSPNGANLTCVLRSGEINIYKINALIESCVETCEKSACEKFEHKRKIKLHLLAKKQPAEELDFKKLQGILKEFGEYPESYRSLIWSKVLGLQNNTKCFSAINNKGSNPQYQNLEKKFPVANKSVLKNFKKILSNLGNWCPMFNTVDFLSLFVFPFVKFLGNDPIVCFETMCSILVNFCQHWFEYAPLAPVNILAMIENSFSENDPQLLAFLAEKDVTAQIYAWPMLETAFSEVLSSKEWCILWDHILSNEPAFLLMVPVAYNILCRSILSRLNTLEEFQTFYHTPNPIGIKKLISKTYSLLKNTSEEKHPRNYLKDVAPLPQGSYPAFENFPKNMTIAVSESETSEVLVDMMQAVVHPQVREVGAGDTLPIFAPGKDSSSSVKKLSGIVTVGKDGITRVNKDAISKLNKEGIEKVSKEALTKLSKEGIARISKDAIAQISTDGFVIVQQDKNTGKVLPVEEEIKSLAIQIESEKQLRQDKMMEVERKQEEKQRIQELEKICEEKKKQKKETSKKRKLELSKLRTQLLDMQAESMEASRKKMEELHLRERRLELEKILKNMEEEQVDDEMEIQKMEEYLSRHYVELLKQKTALENMLLEAVTDDSILPDRYKIIEQQRQNLNKELDEIRKNIDFNRMTTKVKIPMGISVMNDKLQSLDITLAKEMAEKQQHLSMCHNTMHISKMEDDTRCLEEEVCCLLDKFTEAKKQQCGNTLYHITDSVLNRKEIMKKEEELFKSKHIPDDDST